MEEVKALKEAEGWLMSARDLVDSCEGDERFTVVAAQCIHSMIRANDALTLKYLKRRAERHDQAAVLFQELIRQNKLPASESGFRKLLIAAVQSKAGFDYGGMPVGKNDAERWLRDAGKFLAMAKKYV